MRHIDGTEKFNEMTIIMKIQTNIAQLLTLCMLLFFSGSGSASSIINGLAIHSELGQESFIASLFTTTPSTSAAEILSADTDKQIQVRVLADRFSSRRFKRMWIEGMAINASGSDLSSQSQNMAAFSNMLKVTLTKGDIFAIQRTNNSVKVLINGTELGIIDDVEFFDLLLRTWIGSVPLSSQFRDDLLVAGQVDEDLLARFNSIRPSEDRIIAVASALKNAAENKKTAPQAPAKTQIKPQIAQPQIKAPTPIATPEPTPSPEASPSPVPAIATPQVDDSTNTDDIDNKNTEKNIAKSPTTADKAPVTQPNATPAKVSSPPQSEAVALASEKGRDEGASPEIADSVLEEDDEDFTAESLLEQQLYISILKQLVYTKIKYPVKSVQRTEEGLVRMRVSINRDGSLAGVILEQEPEYSRLTRAAIKAVEKSAPFPDFPASISSDEFSFSLPVVFRLVSE